MAPSAHIFCVPFPGGGHGINMFNVALTLANESTKVHTLVLSKGEGLKWQEGTGQPPNEHMTVETLNDGQWEDWRGHTAPELFGMIQSPEFVSAVESAIVNTKQSNPDDIYAAVVYNGIMSGIPALLTKHNLKGYLLMPVPYYMLRMGLTATDGDNDLTQTRLFKGIGGSQEDIEFQLGDATDIAGPMFRQTMKASFDVCSGIICSNTNPGLEGDTFDQPHLPNFRPQMTNYMIGPILPDWYEKAIADTAAKNEHLAKAAKKDPVVEFLDAQKEKSTVYITTGSHMELELDQAKTIIDNLRKYNTPWVLVFRRETETMREMLGGHDIKDGVLTQWSPQLEVMLHPAVKCVLSHGGFGTMIEGVFAGQAFITTPVASDQFMDTKVMMKLGIALGTIAENRHRAIMGMAKISPVWPDDGGKHLEQLFARVFGTPEGEEELKRAREASLALRKRMQDYRSTKGLATLGELRKDMVAT